MKTAPIFIAVLVLCFAAFGQETFEPTPLDDISKLHLTQTCSIPVERSPSIRNLKLETTIEQAQRAFPTGSNVSLVAGSNPLTVPQLANIKAFSDIQDGFLYISESRKPSRLSFISFVYHDRDWNSIREFAKHATKAMDLPFEALVFKDDSATMQCQGWSLILGINSVTIFSSHLVKDRADAKDLNKHKFIP